MKKLIIALFTIGLILSTSFGATVTILNSQGKVVIDALPGRQVELNNEDAGYNGWTVVSGGVTIVDNKFIMPNNDVIVKAANVSDFSIAYNLNGGYVSGNNPTGYNSGTSDITLINPEKTGYIFTGWTGTGLSQATLTVTIPKGSTGNRSYTANWSLAPYQITYNLNDGTVSSTNPTSYNINTNSFTLNNPVKIGAQFIGWTGTGLNTPTMTVTIPKGSTGDRTYTANWSSTSYSISYNLNGGTVTTANPTSYTIETENFTLNNPTRDGYVFAGWTGTDLAGVTEIVTVAKGNTGARTYTANWTIITYNISYDLNNGTLVSANPATYTIETTTFTLKNPSKSGYTFIGWTGTDIDTPSLTVTIPKGSMEDRAYVANFDLIIYPIEYNLNGGTVVANPTSYTVESETFTLNNPTKRGYIFEGWTGTNLAGRTKTVTIERGSIGARTYTANWSLEQYQITYNLNGGVIGTPNPVSYTIETETFTLNNPTKSGYTFGGWIGTDYIGASLTVTIEKGSVGAKTYTATWGEAPYSIEYNLDGGVIDIPNPAGYWITTETFTLNNPTKEGYVFAGWTGTDLYGSSLIVTIAKGSIGDRTYTANWNPFSYPIVYELNGGTASNPESYTIETDTFILNNPTKAGQIFKGWTGTGIVTPTLEVRIEKGSIGDRTYTANWSGASYPINYVLDGGNVTPANLLNYTIDTESFTLRNPVKEGYVFAGWTGTDLAGITKTVTIPKGSMGIRTYIANWIPEVYTIQYNLDGGSTKNPENYTIETETFTLNNPIKIGSEFLGWTGSDLNTLTLDVSIPKGSIGNRTYVANWETLSYSISYNLDGGIIDTPNPVSYTVETETFTLNNPTKEGYEFAGWSGTELPGTPKTVIVAKGNFGNRYYKATWTPKEYTINYDLQYGNATNPEKYTIETSTFVLNNPTKDAIAFTGWTTIDSDMPSMAITIPIGSMGTKNYIATWKAMCEFCSHPIHDSACTGQIVTTNTCTEGSRVWVDCGTCGGDGKVEVICSDWKNCIVCGGDGYSDLTCSDWSNCTICGGDRVKEILCDDCVVIGKDSSTCGTCGGDGCVDTTCNSCTNGKIACTHGNTETHIITNGASCIANCNSGKIVCPHDKTETHEVANGTECGTCCGSRGDYSYTYCSLHPGNWDDHTYAIQTPCTCLPEYTITYDLDGGELKVLNPTTYMPATETFTLINPTKPGYNFNGWTGSGLAEASMHVTIIKGSRENKHYTATWVQRNCPYCLHVEHEETCEIELSTAELCGCPGVIYGDINGDERVTGEDASLLNLYILDSRTYGPYVKTDPRKFGDVDENGVLNSADVLLIQKYVDGEIPELPHTHNMEDGVCSCGITPMYGDINGDYKVSQEDVYLLYNYAANPGTYGTEIKTDLEVYGDVDRNETVDNIDTSLIQKYVNGEIPELPHIHEIIEGSCMCGASFECIITLDSNGGVGSDINLGGNFDKIIFLPLNTFTRDGYRFIGWNTALNGSGTSYIDGASITVTGNITLYAQWEESFTISFNSNGGIGNIDDLNVAVGESITLPLNANSFIKDGYRFIGWNTAQDGSGTSYIDGASITVIENITLYAQWKELFTVTFNNNGGIGNINNLNVAVGESITLPLNTCTRDGYRFIGWNTVQDGSGTSYADGASITVTENITLYAQWEEIVKYTVTTIAETEEEITGVYTNHKCSVCGGYDHECSTINIFVITNDSDVTEI